MRYFYKAVALLFMFFLQSSLCGFIRIIGIAPNILLCAVIAGALTSAGPIEAAVYGLGAGALFDVLWGRVFGVNAILMMYTCFAVYYIAAFIYRKTVISGVVITFLATLMYELIFYAISFLIWGETNVVYFIFRVIIPGAAYTACFQFLLYPIMKKFEGKAFRRPIKNEV